MITIVTRPPDDSPMHLEAIEREIAKGLRNAKEGRIYGPFSAEEATRFIRRELKARAK